VRVKRKGSKMLYHEAKIRTAKEQKGEG